MVSVLSSIMEPGAAVAFNQMTMKLVYTASLLSTLY